MTQPVAPLEVVEEWRRKSNDCSGWSSDPLISVMRMGFEAMEVALTDPVNHNHFRSALASVESERLLSMQMNDTKDDITRGLMYGFIQSFHLTLHQLFEQKCTLAEMIDGWNSIEEAPALNSGEEEMLFNNDIADSDMKAEMKAEHEVENPFNANWTDSMISVRMEDLDEKNETEGLAQVEKDGEALQYATDDQQGRRRSSRTVIKNRKYMEYSEDSNDESVTPMKKSRWNYAVDNSTAKVSKEEGSAIVFNQSESTRKEAPKRKKNDTALDCPKCKYRTHSVSSWRTHFRNVHFTNPTEAGVALRCECGHVSFTDRHSLSCPFTNVTVISQSEMFQSKSGKSKTDDGTLECPECEFYTHSVTSLKVHLNREHCTTPSLITAETPQCLQCESDVYIVCACGAKFTTANDRIHNINCDRSGFTIHKLDGEMEDEEFLRALAVEDYEQGDIVGNQPNNRHNANQMLIDDELQDIMANMDLDELELNRVLFNEAEHRQRDRLGVEDANAGFRWNPIVEERNRRRLAAPQVPRRRNQWEWEEAEWQEWEEARRVAEVPAPAPNDGRRAVERAGRRRFWEDMELDEAQGVELERWMEDEERPRRRGRAAVTEEMVAEAMTLREKDENTPSTDRFSRTCLICAIKNPHVRAVFIRCGHIVCYPCAVDNARSEATNGKCAFCREKSDFVKLFEEKDDSEKKKSDDTGDN